MASLFASVTTKGQRIFAASLSYIIAMAESISDRYFCIGYQPLTLQF
jgi:hypothetical protein